MPKVCHRKATLDDLPTIKKRTLAKRFYVRLGFEDSHDGMKMHLEKTI